MTLEQLNRIAQESSEAKQVKKQNEFRPVSGKPESPDRILQRAKLARMLKQFRESL
jgi:hypothetical protein